jgi:hypothetical protein
MESFEVKRYYEWITTSRQGKVEVYMAEDTNNVYFESGRMIPKEQLEIQLRQADESLYLSRGGESQFAPPPPPQEKSFQEWESILGNPQQNSIAPPSPKEVKEKSAVQIILEKQKKLNETTLSLDIPIKIPNDKAIEFMSVMFDEDEVIDEITNFVQSQISNEVISEIIKDAIKLKVSNYSESGDE